MNPSQDVQTGYANSETSGLAGRRRMRQWARRRLRQQRHEQEIAELQSAEDEFLDILLITIGMLIIVAAVGVIYFVWLIWRARATRDLRAIFRWMTPW